MLLLASFPFLRLSLHDEGAPALEAEWRGFVGSAFLRQALLEALALARHHQIRAWIADDRLLGPVRPADLEWVAAHLLPQLVDIGVQRFAMIEAEDPLNKLLINKTAGEALTSLPITFRRFTSLTEARAWAGSAVPHSEDK
jgi:hypothetical protein